MIFYGFMNSEYLKDKRKIIDSVKERYGIDLSSQIRENYDMRLYEFLVRRIDASNFRNRIQLDDIMVQDDNADIYQKRLEQILNQLFALLETPNSYVADLEAEIYMGLLFNKREKVSPYSVNVNKSDFFDDAEYEEAKQIIRNLQQRVTQMSSFWKRRSNANKISVSSVRDNYPVPVYKKCKLEDDFEVHNIPGGCFWYHNEMIKSSNIGLFDTKTNVKSLKKYTFPRAYSIYSNLKGYPIENSLMMEYTMGIGYTNQIYEHLCDVEEKKKLDFYIELSALGAKCLHIFIREKLMNILWSEIWEEYDGQLIQYIECIMERTLSIIEEILSEVLEVWWYAYYYFPFNENSEKKGRWEDDYNLEIKINTYWNTHYRMYCEKVYEDHVLLCGIHNWLNIGAVEECFVKKDDQSNADGIRKESWQLFLNPPLVLEIKIKDVYGNIKTIQVEQETNKIGRDILEKVKKSRVKEKLPDSLDEVYEIFYAMRRNEFYNLQKKEAEEFCKLDAKVTEKTKTVKYSHIYAILHQVIVKTQLAEIRKTSDIRRKSPKIRRRVRN